MKPLADLFTELLVKPGLVDPAQADFLREAVGRSPEPSVLCHFLVRYATRNHLPRQRHALLALAVAAGHSPFLGQLLLLNPEYLSWAVKGLSSGFLRTGEDLREDLARFRFTFSSLPEEAVYRRFKYREYLRIALRDFVGGADLADTTRELSLLADTILQEATLGVRQEMVNRFGPPQYIDDHGWVCEADFVILSLGKLGGEELNYSSDIDLVYFFNREGQTAGIEGRPESVITNREFFTRLAETLTDRIAGISPEGQVFRVDLGLRPGGKDGEIVHSRRSAIAYYKTWARTWERQALIKARYSAGEPGLGRSLIRELREITFAGSSLPFAALEIKEMKDRIDSQLSRVGRNETDIKLGRGGLRELEFAVQALQLAHGAQEPWLQEGNTLRALHRLADKEKVSYSEHFAVSNAYVFLRRLEHLLQIERNRQTYILPASRDGLRALARRIGYLDAPHEVDSFLRDLEEHRSVVRGFYDSVFGRAAQVSLVEVRGDPLLDDLSDSQTEEFFSEVGIARPDKMVSHAKRIRHLLAPGRIRPAQRREVRKFSASVVREATGAAEPDRVLANLERFLSTLLLDAKASHAFFQRPDWIPPLVHLFGRSEHLSQILIRRPEIFAEVGDVAESTQGRDVGELRAVLHAELGRIREIRSAAALLRKFHNRQVLQVGLRDVHHQDSLERTLRKLTDLAETCLVAGDEVASRTAGVEATRGVGFCVWGLGRLGYRELDYGSDLDLVFLLDDPVGKGGWPEWARRRAEGLIHLLTAVTQEGSLYSVDLRLRPAGSEGELVQTRRRLLTYFRETARTWEKMAFLRARPVAGDLRLGEEVLAEIQEEILREADPGSLAAEVREMKTRVEAANQCEGEAVPLKLGEGGILEIHFLIEYLQILHRHRRPADLDTLGMLSYLHGNGLIPDSDYPQLYSAYLFLRGLDHAIRLVYDRPGDVIPSKPALWNRLAKEVDLPRFAAEVRDGDSLRAKVRETRENVRAIFDRLIR